ncbi:MAG: F0F1 ATP synthase subunit A [Alphaproteobacteria bacterium]|nr:MAG: F0F1 ATP synthase subunit A [Alphaproteobacteria bacterium]
MASPLDQFKIITLVPLKFGSIDISFTNSSLCMLIAAVLCIAIPYMLLNEKRFVIVDTLMEFVRTMTEKYIGDMTYFPLVISLFLFLALSNLIGVIPGAFTTTSHISMTLFLAASMYLFIIGCGFYHNGLGFFRIFFPKGIPVYVAPLLIPIEIISFFTKPISLAVRLFANMLAGHIMVKIFVGFSVLLGLNPFSLLPIGANVLLIGFEVFVAVIQAYVFTLLTCLYLNDVLNLH